MRLLISTQKMGMISNLPYLLKELDASTCEPDVQTMLAANAARITKINMAVRGLLTTVTAELASGSELRNKIMSVPINRATFARLTNPIGRLTDAASAQTSSNRKLMVFLSKMELIVALRVVALSVIRSPRFVSPEAPRLLCFRYKDTATACRICSFEISW